VREGGFGVGGEVVLHSGALLCLGFPDKVKRKARVGMRERDLAIVLFLGPLSQSEVF
jgi:hypothetical protein